WFRRTRVPRAVAIRSPAILRRARTARAVSKKIVKATNAESIKPRSGRKSLIAQTKSSKATPIDASAGQRKLRLRLFQLARRQAIMGPSAMRKTSERKSGTVTELKYGAPTLT